ncbi:sigma 54-interacting transcriptional regulator [Clostridioides difficile]|nr:sigma 54-interacting transcriptional regulator [Clostridioides difficile]
MSEIPLELQGRLLRVLQEKQVMRIGGDKVIPIDVKIICASNKDLKNMMRNGLFRQDLYFRINILTLYLPSLKERKEDIIKLSEFLYINIQANTIKRP